MEKILKAKLPGGVFSDVTPSRSVLMGKVKSKGNRTTEVALRLALVRASVSGWRMHADDVIGCPDFYFANIGLAIFVDGCFWHACPHCGHLPRTRRLFWATKFERNQQRKKFVAKRLNASGIKVLRFWEHEIKRGTDQVVRLIRSNFQ